MDSNSIYEIGIILSAILLLISLATAFIEKYYTPNRKIKHPLISIVWVLLCIADIIFCSKKISDSYKEVYYLEYTVYYPGNTCKFKVDSCNHIYASSDRGTNYIRYYSIPKKDTYGTNTTAPIVINKIIKK